MQNLGCDAQFQEVINAYVNPKCHSPDSDAVQRVCVQHPFLRKQLQELCMQYFGWSPDQIDQYILPKIAERNLRRYANLRTTSSELGVRIPLYKMPIPCPVSTIIKQRKVQGKECFEVSWHELDGLQTSIVPADLMESACPEKIVEFMEKVEGKKKQNRRPRAKKSTKASVSEVHLQLRSLLLGIESQSIQSHQAINSSMNHHQTDLESQFIDLSSPSPPLNLCKVARCRKGVDSRLDAINILEPETDASPEHEKKARELRLFIDKIMEDLY